MGGVPPMLSLGAGTSRGLRRGNSRRVATAVPASMQSRYLTVHHTKAYDAPMPAKHPRLTITMRPALHARLRRLSELTGNSMSSLIFELLDGAEPVLTRVIRLLETAELAKEEMHGRLARDMETAQQRIEHQLGLTLDAFGDDQVVGDLVDLAEQEPARRRRKRDRTESSTGAPAEPTPLSNRGVRSLTNTVQIHSTRRKA